MKPYGRYKKVKGGNSWKRDYHIRRNGKKIKNWWESMCDVLFRSRMKQMIKREINEELD